MTAMRDSKDRWLGAAAGAGQRALRQALDDAATADPIQRGHGSQWTRVQEPWAQPVRSPLAWVLVAICAAAPTIVVLTLLGRPPAETVTTAPQNRARPHRPVVEPFQPPSMAVRPRGRHATVQPSPLATGTSGARERLPRGVDAELAPRTTLLPGDEQTAPEIKSGRVRFSVPHQAPGRRYVVRAGAYQVIVVGTTFVVTVEGEAVTVSVESGVVEVENVASGLRLGRLEPGHRWSSADADREDHPGDRPARPAVARHPAAVADPPLAAILGEARAARLSGDPRRALMLFERLGVGGGPLAESALYEIAEIENDDLHEPRQALSAWEKYRTRYPRGLLRAEADLSIIEALSALGDTGPALDEARAFLRRYPNNERRGEVARVAGELARRRGDCRAALGFYDLAARSRLSATDTDDVAFHRVSCLAATGDPGAPEAIRDYQARFPSGRHAREAEHLGGDH